MILVNEVEKKKRKRKKKRVLRVVIDPGTSLLKVLYMLDDGTVKWITMDSEHLVVPNSSFDLGLNIGGAVENNAWVRLTEDGDCHLLGFLASNNRAFTSVKKLKRSSLKYKILGIIGAIAKKENLGNSFNLGLSVLLPLDESQLSDEYKIEIIEGLSNFYFQNELLKVRAKTVYPYSEGMGLAMFKSLMDDQYFNSKNIIFLMQGYRNTSCISFKKGTFDKRHTKTCDLGFHIILNGFLEKHPELKKEHIYRSISVDLYKLKQRAKSSKDFFNYEEEEVKIDFDFLSKTGVSKDKLMSTYSQVMEEYRSLMKNWLDETLPELMEIDEVIFAGGTSDFMTDFVDDYLKLYSIPTSYSQAFKHLKKYLLYKKADGLEVFMKENLALRLADAWGLFINFTDYDLSKVLDPETGELKNE